MRRPDGGTGGRRLSRSQAGTGHGGGHPLFRGNRMRPCSDKETGDSIYGRSQATKSRSAAKCLSASPFFLARVRGLWFGSA